MQNAPAGAGASRQTFARLSGNVLGFDLVEDRNRQAVKFRIRRLGNDLVDDLIVWIYSNPIGNEVTKQFALFRFGRGKYLHTSQVDVF